MKIDWQDIKVNGKMIYAKVTIKENGDQAYLKEIYTKWLWLNKEIKSHSTRGINIPEFISENSFCIFFPNCIRVTKLKKGKCSFDAINTDTGKRIQIKATSIKSDLTSFGPRSEWDELYFLDFSAEDCSFKVYNIKKEWIYSHQVNKIQSFQQQQEEKRRPRFSIIEKIIKPNNLKPIKVCKL